ncbi:acylphosphatase [Candidatus Fermentibacteria bacterium]|nr:acylphosphatase [Candidatus Fermentibacteria bacterium]
MVERRRFTVRGRVQGVGYRWFVLRRARALELCGWARNMADGGVELEAQGERDTLDALEVALSEGPRLCHVEQVTWIGIPAHADQGFRIVL